MPTYDYECRDCNHTFEAFQSITADPLQECPACKKSSLHRLIGKGAGLIFKGSGFYQTDYKNTKPAETSTTKPTEHKPADPAKATEPKTYKKEA